MSIKQFYITTVLFILPSPISMRLVRLLGYNVSTNSKVGFSIIICKEIIIEDYCKIGHFNIITNKSIKLKSYSRIGYLNILHGSFNLNLENNSVLLNKNYLTRAQEGVTYGLSQLNIGYNSIITTGHHLDLTRSITFGDHSILAGIRSQMWTHGYYHAETGPDRCRIDGEIKIGDNVYIGSGCIFNPGVSVGNAIHIGAGAVISKNLEQPGMYVGQALRYIATNFETVKSKLHKVEDYELIEEVYEK